MPTTKKTVHASTWIWIRRVACGRERKLFSVRRTTQLDKVTCLQCLAVLAWMKSRGMLALHPTRRTFDQLCVETIGPMLRQQKLWARGPMPWRTPGADPRA